MPPCISAQQLSHSLPIMQLQRPIQFRQINLAKSKVATANFGSCMVKWSDNSLFALIQEPATTKRGRIESLPRGTQTFSAGLHPRAAVLATPELNVWAMPEHTSRDVASCLWKTDSTDFPEIIIISVYSDINKDTISPELLCHLFGTAGPTRSRT